ncbi:coiled-coil domain-containing protein 124-like [Senna tora]|uniref:Coiled-coil domain-containing protein 124-like n=1 Tax=Senna tora TaxID=362788 RepID=A0A835CJI3_9FABA|nr:coiled-coil domain-containing protein 124-like [Senna tora]
MPKKMGVNSKAEAARARKGAVEAERKDREVRDKEDQYWRDAEGSKSRAAKKREEEAEKKAEAAARRAEARRLAEQEEKEFDKSMKKPDKKANRVAIPVPKVTEAELRKRREEEQAEMQKKTEEAKKRQTRTAEEEEYERMVLVTNTNRDDSVIEARSVEDALAQMSVTDNLPVDRHPERRLKASFKAFEEAELPKLKEEKPGLTHNQYKDMIWKLWKKSPDNPLNQICRDPSWVRSDRPEISCLVAIASVVLCACELSWVGGYELWVLLAPKDLTQEAYIVAPTSKQLWLELKEKYGTDDMPKVLSIRKKLANLKQNGQPLCLTGLDDTYDRVVSNVLMMDPIPSPNKTYSIVTRIENHTRIATTSSTNVNESSALAVKVPDSQKPVTPLKGFVNKKDEKKVDKLCSHCNKPMHIKEASFKKHGYLDWYKEMNNQQGKKSHGLL